MNLEEIHVSNVYSNIASQFDKSRYKIWDSTAKEIKSLNLNENPTVLEIGCGNGRNLNFVKKINPNANLIGIEPCKELFEKINLEIKFNFGHFSESLKNFKEISDLTLSIAVIHHFSTPERRKQAVKELIEMTKSGGYIIIQVMKFQGYRKMDYFKNLGNSDYLIPWLRTGDYRFYHLFEENELDLLCNSHNVEKIHKFEDLRSDSRIEILRRFEDWANYGIVLKKK